MDGNWVLRAKPTNRF